MKNDTNARMGIKALLIMTMLGGGTLISGCTQDPAEGLRNQGLQLYQEGDYDAALDKFNQALTYNESEPRANYYAGVTEYKLGKYEQAAYYYKMAWTVDPDYGDVKAALANTLIKEGKTNEAMNFLERNAALTGQISDRLLVAQFYQKIGDLDDAKVNYERCVALAQDDPTILMQAGIFYDSIGQKDQAITVYEQAYRIDPTTPGLYDRLNADGVVISEILPPPSTTAPSNSP
ncbi:MAG TPA: tetratricopeptide repeat protein [Phycisphaerae bacterium]|nr:tetratricopeptide repeat protein [Phycisphaerae bacterium]